MNAKVTLPLVSTVISAAGLCSALIVGSIVQVRSIELRLEAQQQAAVYTCLRKSVEDATRANPTASSIKGSIVPGGLIRLSTDGQFSCRVDVQAADSQRRVRFRYGLLIGPGEYSVIRHIEILNSVAAERRRRGISLMT